MILINLLYFILIIFILNVMFYYMDKTNFIVLTIIPIIISIVVYLTNYMSKQKSKNISKNIETFSSEKIKNIEYEDLPTFKPKKKPDILLKQKYEEDPEFIKKRNENKKRSYYFSKKPKDNYLDHYNKTFIFYEKNKKIKNPYLGHNQEGLASNLAALDEVLCDLDISKITKKKKSCFINNYLDKGAITNLKQVNYYNTTKELKKNSERHEQLPDKRVDYPLDFKCQRNYMICNTEHKPNI